MSRKYRLDLRSDTVSVPSQGMRRAMAEAAVGDDVFGEDPTINSLEERVAGLLGKEAALFVPSGTMGNGLSIRALTTPGDRVLCGSMSHVYNYEGDQFALNCGLQMHRLDEGSDGLIPVADVAKAIPPGGDIHRSPVSLLSLENTHNLLGGRVPPQSNIDEVCAVAKNHGIKLFLDGARLWHAHVASGMTLSRLAGPFDMVSVCFSKALGAPVGSVVAGSADMIARARWFRKRMGGGMRQVGILGAACHYALDNNLPRLSLTHDYAKKLASAFSSTGRFKINPDAVDTNILFVGTVKGGAKALVSALEKIGLGVLALDDSSVRLVTHLSLDSDDIDRVAKQITKEF